MNAPTSLGNIGGVRTIGAQAAFTRTDLAVVGGGLFALALFLTLGVLQSRANNHGASCLNNLRRLSAAWQLYSNDSNDHVANNYGKAETVAEITSGRFGTWANNVMTWEVDGIEAQSVTNAAWVRKGPLDRYLNGKVEVYHCPADRYLSPRQQTAGYVRRVRSVSMNAFFGRSGAGPDATINGLNKFMPSYRQFLKRSQVPDPAVTFLFVDEQADSINDGYFLNRVGQDGWEDLPAAYHDGGCSFSFADGSALLHRWSSPTSMLTVKFERQSQPWDKLASEQDWPWFYQHAGFSKIR